MAGDCVTRGTNNFSVLLASENELELTPLFSQRSETWRSACPAALILLTARVSVSEEKN
jgi:hypothetical protein